MLPDYTYVLIVSQSLNFWFAETLVWNRRLESEARSWSLPLWPPKNGNEVVRGLFFGTMWESYLRGSYHNFTWSTERIPIDLKRFQFLRPRQCRRRHRRPDVRLHLEHRRLANPVTAKPPNVCGKFQPLIHIIQSDHKSRSKKIQSYMKLYLSIALLLIPTSSSSWVASDGGVRYPANRRPRSRRAMCPMRNDCRKLALARSTERKLRW